MSFTELKEQVAGLSAKERLQLAAFLSELEEGNEAAFRTEADRRMKAMDAGRKVTEEELLKRHNDLFDQGR